MLINYSMKNNHYWVLFAVALLFAPCGDAGTKTAMTAVETTASGYSYMHHVKNDGPKVKIGDRVKYHQITKKNKEVVNSTYLSNTPYQAILPGADKIAQPVHPSWEGLQLMAVGDSMSLIQPIGEANAMPQKGLNATDTLFYDIVVVEIQSKEEVDQELAAIRAREESVATSTMALIEDYKKGAAKNIQTTESGLKYIIHNEGEGANPAQSKFVLVHYSGHLLDGTKFDNSFGRGEPISFPLGQGRVIPGWDEGIALLKKGGSATLFIPYDLAYGEAGSPPNIPPRSELAFFVELVDIL